MRQLVGAIAIVVVLGVAPAAAQLQLPAKPQTKSLDSEAPEGAPPHWLPAEEWVMQHWLPYDEERLYRALRADRGTVWRWLRDDTRDLAGLARDRGLDPAALARELVAPWKGRLEDPRRLELLQSRALRTLTQGHLAQHIFFHSLHQNAIPDNAPAIFGTASREEFQALRRAELSPLQICRLNGLSRDHAERAAVATLKATAARAVKGEAMPKVQADRLLARQLAQVPRWLQQTRYNGPPPLKLPRASIATASNYSNNPVLSGDGTQVVYEGYEARLPLAKTKGEITVLAHRLGTPAGIRVARPTSGFAQRVPRSVYNPAVSADGRWVAFESAEANLNFAKRYGQMRVYLRDLKSGRAQRLGHDPVTHFNPAVSGAGEVIAYETPKGVFAEERNNGRVWPARRARAHEPALSADGRVLAFVADSAVFRQELRTGKVQQVSAPGVEAWEPSLSGDGSGVAYTALVDGRSRVHVGAAAIPAPARDGWTSEPSLSLSGTRVAFAARAATGRRQSIWVHDVSTGRSELVSRASGATGPPADGSSTHPSLSGDGRRVAFTSDAWNLAAGKCNPARGVFLRDLVTQETTLVSRDDGANRFLGPTKGSSVAGDMFVHLLCA